jgi:hypothetical protein
MMEAAPSRSPTPVFEQRAQGWGICSAVTYREPVEGRIRLAVGPGRSEVLVSHAAVPEGWGWGPRS